MGILMFHLKQVYFLWNNFVEPIMESFDSKNWCASMALLHEKDNHDREDKRSNKGQKADTHQSLKRHIPVMSL